MSDEPTEDEMKQANAIFARKRAADMARMKASAGKIKAIFDMPGFEDIEKAVTEASDEIGEGQPFFAHLNAMAVGTSWLRSDYKASQADQPAPDAAPAATDVLVLDQQVKTDPQVQG